jgi:Bacterial pre-peptidase C-terminal domain
MKPIALAASSSRWYVLRFDRFTLLGWLVGVGTGLFATLPAVAAPIYNPLPIVMGQELKDRLTDRDIPTGQGGFARDYSLELNAGDQIAIDLISDTFDPMVVLMTKDGVTVAENDDGPDGTSNSLLFMRVVKTGSYIVRVRSFGETAGGPFQLIVTPLKKR